MASTGTSSFTILLPPKWSLSFQSKILIEYQFFVLIIPFSYIWLSQHYQPKKGTIFKAPYYTYFSMLPLILSQAKTTSSHVCVDVCANWINFFLNSKTNPCCRSLSVITMMWQYSVPCLNCVLGPQEPMKYPSFLATRVKGEKYLRLEHYGVLQVVATLTV